VKINLLEFFALYGGEMSGSTTPAQFGQFVVDSRKVSKGDVFVAIKGNTVDGHDFVLNAIKKGAYGVIVENKVSTPMGFQYVVKNTNDFLVALGGYVRNKFKGSFIGITGSAGKTTTKEMIAHVLSSKFSVSKAFANMNTDISLPLFLANSADENSEFVVIELGVQRFGDMDRLLKIAEPDKGIILNIGDSHLEYLMDRHGVLTEKFKLVSYLQVHNGLVFLNSDDEMIESFSKKFTLKKVYFGLKNQADVKGNIVDMGFGSMKLTIDAFGEHAEEVFPFSGYNLAIDALASIAVGIDAGISLSEAASSLATFELIKGRGNNIRLSNSIMLIDETYNSNPLSLVKSLESFRNRGDRHLILILGDMLELGENACSLHESVGKFVSSLKPDVLFTFGPLSVKTANFARDNGVKHVFSFVAKGKALDFLKKLEIFENSIIFVKGSRGMKMEEFVEIIVERFKNGE
jgi:UDP-N-acetylmuramoyl-tripeptide--D-alanyl-D-alanine ligase